MGEEMIKILYITYDGIMDPLGQSQVMPYLTGLASLGTDITLLSFEKPQSLRDKEKVDKTSEELRDSRIRDQRWQPPLTI